ncbi:hypothetical protein C804_04591 [Lachnospiraceae bacterium A4]|jgi:hypothetical protein|nr:hypothetical protein C804_04591 [Lachnospiraceae bacterium A4]
MNEIEMLSIHNRECICYDVREAQGTLLVGLVVEGGSVLEEECEKGYTHFLEHVMLSFSKEDRRIRCRGYTDFYYTYYIFSITSDMFNVCMELIDEILAGKYITTYNVEKVRKDVIAEYKEFIVSKKEFNYILEGTDYINHLAIGKIENIQSCNSCDLFDFFKEKYQSQFIDIIIIGDTSKIDAKKCITKKHNYIGDKKEISVFGKKYGAIINAQIALNGIHIFFYKKRCYKNKISYVTEIAIEEILFSLIESITSYEVSKINISSLEQLVCIKLSDSSMYGDANALLNYIQKKMDKNIIQKYIREYRKQYKMYISKGTGVNLEKELLRCINDLVYNGEIIGYKEMMSIIEQQLDIISMEQIFEAYHSMFNQETYYVAIKNEDK